jgi:tetratricopeptide (TPR) repeat protein
MSQSIPQVWNTLEAQQEYISLVDSDSLIDEYEDTGIHHHLQRALVMRMEEVRASPHSHVAALRLGEALLIEHERFSTQSSGQDALEQFKRVIHTTCPQDPHHIRGQVGLIHALVGRYLWHSNTEDAQSAIHEFRSVIQKTSDVLLRFSAARACVQFPRHVFSDRAIITETDMDAFQECLLHADLTPICQRYTMVRTLQARSQLYWQLSRMKSQLHLADGAIDTARQAANLCHDQSPLQWANHALLSFAYITKASRANSLEALHEAQIATDKAISLQVHEHQRTKDLHRQGAIYGHRSGLTGDLEDLEHAITHTRSALQACPPENHGLQLAVLVSLTGFLGMHHQFTGSIQDLDDIVEMANIPGALANHPVALNIVEAMLLRCSVVGGESKSHLLKQAVQLILDHLDDVRSLQREEGHWYSHLRTAYRIRCAWQGSIRTDADQYVAYAHKAVASLQVLDPIGMETWMAVVDLASALLVQASRRKSLDDIDQAETRLASALADFNMAPVWLGKVVTLQAKAMALRHQLTGTPGLLRLAWKKFEDTISDDQYSLVDRFRAAMEWADLADIFEPSERHAVFTALRNAVDLIDRTSYVIQDLAGRLKVHRMSNGLPSRVAASALRLGHVETAIELLEQSRGVMWTQSLHLRTPLSLVPEIHKGRLAGLMADLEQDIGDDPLQRRIKAKALEALAHEIRSVPGYSGFLSPQPFHELVHSATKGYVVILIPSATTCDVVIISETIPNSKPRHLQLPALNIGRLRDLAQALKEANCATRESIDETSVFRKMRIAPVLSTSHGDVLAELWIHLVQPIVRSLDLEVRLIGSMRPRLANPDTFCRLCPVGIAHVCGGVLRGP